MSNGGHVTASVSGLWFGGWLFTDRVRAPALLADRARRGHLAVLRRRCRGAVGTRGWRFRPAVRGDVTAAHLLYKLALDKLDISRG